MKRSLPIAALVGAAILGISHTAYTNANSAPTGKSGSPASNNTTCTSCHAGSAVTVQTISITSDIPAPGFAPNTDYTITVTGNDGGASASRIGFSASVEDGNGHAGTLTAADSRTTVNNNFASHRSSSLTPTNGSNTWDLSWNSGSAEDGATVYVAMNFANGNGTTSGDVIETATLSLTKDGGVHLNEFSIAEMSVYPNPASEILNVEFNASRSQFAAISVIDLNGKVVISEKLGNINAGDHVISLPLNSIPSGTYILHLSGEESTQTERFIVQ